MAVTAVRKPEVTLQMISRDQRAKLEDHRICLVGQMLTGTASAGLVKDLPQDDAEINALFGARSHLAMVARAFRDVNKVTECDVIALADAGGATQGTAVLLTAGTSTEEKTIYVDVVSSQNHSYEIDVAVGETPATLSTKLLAKTALDTEAPFTVAASMTTSTDDTHTFTAANGGTICNSWLIRIRDEFGNPASVAGLTFTLTGWTGGATDPTLTTALDPIDNIRYHGILWPAEYATTEIEAFMEARFNLDNDIKDGVAFMWIEDTDANAKTKALALNSSSMVLMTNKPRDDAHWRGPHIPEAPDVIVAKFVAARARRFETGEPVSDLVSINEFNDQRGGRHMASLPYFNTPILRVAQPERGTGYTREEQGSLEDGGVTVVGQNYPNNAVIVGAVVMTYANKPSGAGDDTWHWLNWRDQHSVIREYFVNNIRLQMAQFRMTTGRAVSGYAMADREFIAAFTDELYNDLTEDAITVQGRAAMKIFQDNRVIQFVPDERKIRLDLDVPMVSQAEIITGSVKFNFGI